MSDYIRLLVTRLMCWALGHRREAWLFFCVRCGVEMAPPNMGEMIVLAYKKDPEAMCKATEELLAACDMTETIRQHIKAAESEHGDSDE